MNIPEPVRRLEQDLRAIFGPRLSSLSIYGAHGADHAHDGGHHEHAAHGHQSPPTHTLAVVDGLSPDDLRACAARVEAWHEAGLATPLLIGAHEFEASLDTFPLEFGAMIADHVVVAGGSPFDGLAVDRADLRRAVEVQARGHLLHMREGFVETRGRSDALSVLIVSSAPPLAALLLSVARLEGVSSAKVDLSTEAPSAKVGTAARHAERMLGLTSGILAEVAALAGVREISSAEGDRLFAPYLDAIERLVKLIDGWNA